MSLVPWFELYKLCGNKLTPITIKLQAPVINAQEARRFRCRPLYLRQDINTHFSVYRLQRPDSASYKGFHMEGNIFLHGLHSYWRRRTRRENIYREKFHRFNNKSQCTRNRRFWNNIYSLPSSFITSNSIIKVNYDMWLKLFGHFIDSLSSL